MDYPQYLEYLAARYGDRNQALPKKKRSQILFIMTEAIAKIDDEGQYPVQAWRQALAENKKIDLPEGFNFVDAGFSGKRLDRILRSQSQCLLLQIAERPSLQEAVA